MRIKIIYTILFCLLGLPVLLAQYNKELSGDVYKQHRGEILLSDTEVDLADFNEKDIQNNFDLMDEIYGRIILEKSLAEIYKDNNYVYDFNNSRYDYNYSLLLFVDGEKRAGWLFELSENYFNYALSFDLVLSSRDKDEIRNNSDFVNEWVHIISTLKAGERKLRLEVVPLHVDVIGDVLPVIASGSFTLNVQKDKIDDYLAERTADLPPVTMINKSIEEKIVAVSDDIYPYATPLRAFITEITGDWTYSIDDYGNILYRHIIASVVYKFSMTNDCWVKTGLYSQKHQGYGNFGPMLYNKETNGYYDYQIPCWRVTTDE